MAFSRLALGVMLGAPVNVVIIDRVAGVRGDELHLLDHQDRPLRRVGDLGYGGLATIGGTQVTQQHRGGVAPLRALVQDGEAPLGVCRSGLGAGLRADAVLAQLGGAVLEHRAARHRQQ